MLINSKRYTNLGVNIVKITICFLFSLTCVSLHANSLDAAQVVNKGATTLQNAKGIKLQYTINVNGRHGSGSLVSKGSKFYIDSPLGMSWFNGINLYTYNPRSKETTVTKPTATELSEINPLAYIHCKRGFIARDMPSKKGKRVVSLTPKDTKLGLKLIVLTLNEATCLPEQIIITPTNGGKITVDIKNLQLNVLPDAKTFEYPKSRFPKAEVIDMR